MQQAVRQLQEQHYHQYMQQLQQNYEPGKELEITTNATVANPEEKIIEHENICNEQCENGPCLSGECMLTVIRCYLVKLLTIKFCLHRFCSNIVSCFNVD